MTTSTNEAQKRTIDDIIDLPYSELTNEEIDMLVQYKADKQTRDNLHSQQIQAIENALQENIAANQAIADYAKQRLDELTSHAIQRYEDAI